jgi:hypothetical protein
MQVQTEALNRALKLLNAAGCSYAVIDAEGHKYGGLDVVEPKPPRKQRHRNHPIGTFIDYHRQFTNALKPGEAVKVPLGPFTSPEDTNSLRSSISAYFAREIGPGKILTVITSTEIEVLRIE